VGRAALWAHQVAANLCQRVLDGALPERLTNALRSASIAQ